MGPSRRAQVEGMTGGTGSLRLCRIRGRGRHAVAAAAALLSRPPTMGPTPAWIDACRRGKSGVSVVDAYLASLKYRESPLECELSLAKKAARHKKQKTTATGDDEEDVISPPPSFKRQLHGYFLGGLRKDKSPDTGWSQSPESTRDRSTNLNPHLSSPIVWYLLSGFNESRHISNVTQQTKHSAGKRDIGLKAQSVPRK